MKIWNRFRGLFKRGHSSPRGTEQRAKATPKVLAAAIVPLAASHSVNLRKAFGRAESKAESQELTEELWREALGELLRAHFCLASLHVCRSIDDPDLSNLYGYGMLSFLRAYPDDKHAFVRQAFGDNSDLDDAVSCYVNGRLNDRDERAIEDARNLLQLSEENRLNFFAGKGMCA